MRQGQPQNRQRSRGRGNNNNNNNSNNRSNHNRNQLNRSMESNGPDVRIRGTAQHIAEKYIQLARDAQTAGDTVAAESYWQFAEHYNRLIAIAQAAQAEQQAQRDEERARRTEEPSNEDGDAEDSRSRARGRGRGRNRSHESNVDSSSETSSTNTSESNGSVSGEGPQPVLETTPAEVALNEPAVVAEVEKPVEKPKVRRPRKKAVPAAAETVVADSAQELPAFISGSADE